MMIKVSFEVPKGIYDSLKDHINCSTHGKRSIRDTIEFNLASIFGVGNIKNITIIKYPTIKDIEAANKEQLCKWYRSLDTPKNDEELEIMTLICNRCFELGGFTPKLIKKE